MTWVVSFSTLSRFGPTQVLYISRRDGPRQDGPDRLVSTNGQGTVWGPGTRIGSGTFINISPLAARVRALVRARRHGLPRLASVAPRSEKFGPDGAENGREEKPENKDAEDAVRRRRRHYL